MVFEMVDAHTMSWKKEKFSLAGHRNGLIYKAWCDKQCPLDAGWKVSADELIALHSGGRLSYATNRLIIDFDPMSQFKIGLVELLHIYSFTWSGGNGAAAWTPFMIKMRDVYYSEDEIDLDEAERFRIYSSIKAPVEPYTEAIEFLYLRGAEGQWNWGRAGRTNAAFLHKNTLEYFRRFF
jgi:hypothetical protein